MANLLRLVACLTILLSFNAFAVDTDGDGFSDADEATLGTDPNDPTSPMENKLTASDGAQGDTFGFSVSIDGDTAVIGAFGDYDNGLDSGSAYVYIRNNGVWTEQQKITASDGASGDTFGSSVSIDGDTAVIGAASDDAYSGSTYVFVRNNGVWSEQQKITASDGAASDQFGKSVSIDGDTAVIGARYDDDNSPDSGSAYVYVRNNDVWSEQQKITASDGASGDTFGISVSIDGDTAVIGARNDDDNGQDSGSAYVYVRSNGVWAEQQKLTASDGASYDQYSWSVSIDGDTALIGARYDDDNGLASGSAYVYVRSNGVWAEQQKLTASDGASYDQYSWSVSIDGDTAVIGAFGDDDNGLASGSAYVYDRNNGVWTEQQKITASDGASGDYFGKSVSIDGDTAVISAFGDDHNGSYSGSAYIFPLTLPHQDTPAVIIGDTTIIINKNQSPFRPLNASDIDGLTQGNQINLDTQALHGQAFVFQSSYVDLIHWVYEPSPNYIGFDSFTIKVTDDLGGETIQTITIEITDADRDGDSIYDLIDNCPDINNTSQNDLDDDGIGDACDLDIDGDLTRNTVEIAAGLDPNDASDGDQAELSALEALGINKQVPAMGGIGLLALGLSMLGLGAVRLRRK